MVAVAVAEFLPSTCGFAFKNAWPQIPATTLPLPGGIKIPVGDASNGLCGGMIFGARDYFEKGIRVPSITVAPASGPLYEHTSSRLTDSFDLPLGAAKYLEFMQMPDADQRLPLIGITRHGIMWHTITEELPAILADLDGGRLSCLALVCVSGINPFDLGRNHQVAAYRYERAGATVQIWVYDPNRPHGDNVRLEFNTANPSKRTKVAFPNGSKQVRGFFRTPYTPLSPPNENPNLAPGRIGSWISLTHQATGRRLHSHPFEYSHSGGSGQQQVTCVDAPGTGSDMWRVRAEHGSLEHGRWSTAIRNGDVIRLEHIATNRHLHSHTGYSSPVTRQQEVTCFGTHGVGDDNDNWRVELPGTGMVKAGSVIRLAHVHTNVALHSHVGFSHSTNTLGQQEVTGYLRRDDNDLWIVGT